MKSNHSTRICIRDSALKIHSCKRSQVAMEYLIIIGFVTFAVITIMAVAYFYSNMAKDRIISNQAETSIKKIISSAEAVFYAGEPSKATITVYIPESVKNITIQDDNIILEISTSTGILKRAFPSKVKIEGSISSSPGTRRVNIQALQDRVRIS